MQDVLKLLNKTVTSTEATVVNHTDLITKNTDVINTKADATVIIAVDSLTEKVEAIEKHLKKEEDQGISVRHILI
jgi:hypothetical protein